MLFIRLEHTSACQRPCLQRYSNHAEGRSNCTDHTSHLHTHLACHVVLAHYINTSTSHTYHLHIPHNHLLTPLHLPISLPLHISPPHTHLPSCTILPHTPSTYMYTSNTHTTHHIMHLHILAIILTTQKERGL